MIVLLVDMQFMIGGKNMSLEDVGLKMIIIVLVFLVLPTVIYMIVHDIIYKKI